MPTVPPYLYRSPTLEDRRPSLARPAGTPFPGSPGNTGIVPPQLRPGANLPMLPGSGTYLPPTPDPTAPASPSPSQQKPPQLITQPPPQVVTQPVLPKPGEVSPFPRIPVGNATPIGGSTPPYNTGIVPPNLGGSPVPPPAGGVPSAPVRSGTPMQDRLRASYEALMAELTTAPERGERTRWDILGDIRGLGTPEQLAALQNGTPIPRTNAPINRTPGSNPNHPATAPGTLGTGGAPSNSGQLGFATTPGMPNPNASYTANMTPQELVAYQMNQLLSSNSPYMQNAARRGLETAASRGLLNSSIASGASTRSAIEAALPIASQDAASNLSVQNQNRQFRFGEAAAQNQMSRQDWLNAAQTGREFQYRDALSNNDAYRSNWLSAQQTQRDFTFRDQLANNDAQRSDWLSNNEFQRSFNANMAMMPITSSFDFFNRAMQASLDDPSVFTPDVVNGLSQFNIQSLNNILAQYMGTASGASPATTGVRP